MTLLSPQLLTDSLAIARQAGEHLQRFYQRFELAADSKSAVQNAFEILFVLPIGCLSLF